MYYKIEDVKREFWMWLELRRVLFRSVDYIFQKEINKSKTLLFCLNAHIHKHKEEEYFNDGIIYISCENIEKRSFLLFTIEGNNYKYKLIRF